MKQKKQLILTLALMIVFGAAQVQAQNTETKAAQIEREVAELTKQYEAGKITVAQFEQKVMEIYNRLSPGMEEEMQREAEQDAERQEQQRQRESEQAERETEEAMRPKMPGTEGWPPAEAFARYGKTIGKPAGTYVASYERDGDELTIHLWKNFGLTDPYGTGTPNYPSPTQNYTESEMRAFAAHFERIFGTPEYGATWVNRFIENGYYQLDMQDPKHANANGNIYSIVLAMEWGMHKGILTLKIAPAHSAEGQ
jgi:hypothetical protein